jgi:hypothetical protein
MTSPSTLSIPNLTVLVMQDFASVLRDRRFVQMAAVVQIKFKSSVARGMHPRFAGSQTGTAEPGCAIARTLAAVFAVDRA